MFKADELVKFAKEKIGCGYVYGTYGDICTPALRQRKAAQYPAQKNNIMNVSKKWDGKQVFDCAGLIKGYLFNALGVRYDKQYDKGATGMFRDWCKEKNGQWQTLPETPGTLLFKGKPGDFPHVGIYIGGGQVVEAKGAADGVVQTAFKGGGWNYWGQPDIIEYGNTGNTDETDRPTLKRGMSGAKVKEAQELLITQGCALPKYGADGQFGDETENAVKDYQLRENLTVDGVIGKNTWAALLNINKPIDDETELKPTDIRELYYIPKNFMRGDDVKRVQERLKELELYADEAHGAFNAKTDTAVRRFQKLNGIEPTGRVDAETLAALRILIARTD